jgi:hypothetical protein
MGTAMGEGDRSDIPARAVGLVQRRPPVHARGLLHLVGINSNICQGDPINDMRVDFDLNCGLASVTAGGQNFLMGLRTCFVSLQYQNCSMRVGSQYRHWLERGTFKTTETKKTSSERSREGGAGLDIDLNPIHLILSVLAKLRLGASRKHEEKSDVETEQSARIGLVVPSGQDRWRVGDITLGDARQKHGLLDGEYFNEERTNDEDPMPLCKLEWADVTTPVQVVITVSAPFDGLLVFMPDRKRADDTSILQKAKRTIKSRSRQTPPENDALRPLVAGLVAAKTIHKAQKKSNSDPTENEFVIARQTLFASLEHLSSSDMATNNE